MGVEGLTLVDLFSGCGGLGLGLMILASIQFLQTNYIRIQPLHMCII